MKKCIIKRVLIKNFKSIKHCDIELNKGINVLIGPNGAGKSNFISFFKLIQSFFWNSDINNYINNQLLGTKKIFNSDAIKKNDGIDCHITFSDLDDNNNETKWVNHYKFHLLNTADNSSTFFSYEAFALNDIERYPNQVRFVEYNTTRKSSIFYKNEQNIDEVRRNLSGRKYDSFNAYQNISKRLYNISFYHFHDVGNNSPLKKQYYDLSNSVLDSWGSNLGTIIYQMSQNKQDKYEMLLNCIKSVAPYFVEFKFILSKYNNMDVITLLWMHKNYDELMSIFDFSDGTIRFIALCTALLESSENKIILIDEPELGLHPSALKILADVIKMSSRQNQIIITTQNAQFLSEFNSDNIYVTDYINGESIIKKLSDDKKLTNLINDLSDSNTLGQMWESGLIGGDIKW